MIEQQGNDLVWRLVDSEMTHAGQLHKPIG
jgi:hypothetical protein